MSIATKGGDAGQTSLAGGQRVSKSSLHVETIGTIDELISSIGAARSICQDPEIADLAKEIQRELFLVSAAIATAPGKDVPEVTQDMVERLTGHVYSIEKVEGILSDWSIPGEHPVSAAFDLARTVCRRAERIVVKLKEEDEEIHANILAYVNRLSDLLWLMGRLIEVRAGINSSLRENNNSGKPWSRAW